MTPQAINLNLFNMHNITIEQIINGEKDKLPRNGDTIKIRTLRSKENGRFQEFVYIFNFTLGNCIRITKIANNQGEIVERVARLVTPNDINTYFDIIVDAIDEGG